MTIQEKNQAQRKSRTLRKAAISLLLASKLMVSGLIGCNQEPNIAIPKAKPAIASPAMAKKTGQAKAQDVCDIEFTKDELTKTLRTLRKDCFTKDSTVVAIGDYVGTKSGREMAVVRKDSEGATLAFGAKGSYLVTTYVSFDTITTLLVPPMLRGKEEEKMKSLNEDALILLCPRQSQLKKGLRIVSRPWGAIKCDIALGRGVNKENELERMIEETRQKLRNLRKEFEKKQQPHKKKEYEWQRGPQSGDTLA